MNRERDRLSELLKSADRVPDAPDCTRAVRARIATPAPRLRLAWTYATAMLVLIGLVMGSARFLAPGPHPEKPSMVKIRRQTSNEHTAHQLKQQQQTREPAIRLRRQPEPTEMAVSKPVRKPSAARTPHRDETPEPVEQCVIEVTPAPDMPEPAVLPERGAPVALVVVTGPAPEQSESYAYRQTDPETGKTIECSATRNGNTVELYCVESTPGEKQPPVKGSLDYEIPNA